MKRECSGWFVLIINTNVIHDYEDNFQHSAVGKCPL